MHHVPAALLAAVLSAAALAQTPPCFSLNDANTTVSKSVTSFGFSGQNTRAWQITPSTALPVQALQLFTANTSLTGSRFMIVELWSDASGVPGARLAGGTFKIVNARPASWQGADLDAVVVLLPSTPVWVVWIDPGFSTIPVEPGGATVVPEMTRSGAVWTSSGASAPKVRFFCSQLDGAHTAPFGVGCVLSTGGLPSVFTNEQPQLGNAGFFFETSGNPSGAPVFLVLGLDPNFVALPAPLLGLYCYQNTDIVSSVFLSAGTGNTRGPTCAGYASLSVPIPAVPAYLGTVLAAQAVAFDAGSTAPLPFAASNAQRVTLF
jgi:hypothetical protein